MRHLTLAFLLFALSSLSFAYGPLGHRTVAALAWDQLTPYTKQNVERILGKGKERFMNASTWADEIKSNDDFDYLKPYHYVNLKKGSGQYVRSRDCRKDRCVVEGINKFTEKLKTGSPKEQKMALRMVIHLVADVHQPMHAGLYEDRGGNWYEIKYKKRRTNLHKFWDNQAVKRQGKKVKEVVAKLKDYPIKVPLKIPAKWAEESHAYAVSKLYAVKEGKEPNQAYLEMTDELTQQQLAHAGWRLALWLNRVWR